MKNSKIKKHMKKRLWAMLMAVVMIICAIPTIGLTASAASTTAFDILTSTKYAKTYVLATSGKTIPYTSSNLSTRGTVSYGANKNSYIDNKVDDIRIIDVGRNSKGVYWTLVSYPSGSKRVNAYIELSAVTPNNGSHAKAVSSGKFNCAPRRDSAISGSYYVSKGDTVYLVASYGSRYQILYPSGSVWRLAWCNASDYNKFCASAAPANTSKTVKFLSTAKGQIGYQGTNSNGYGKGDYTKYGKFTGTNGQPWCAAFVAWCANQAGISTSVIPKSASCSTMASNSNSYVKWSSNALRNLDPGDVIFFSSGGVNGTKRHVGIVSAVSGNKVTVIEGNTSSDLVKSITYTVNTSGYINQNWTYSGKSYAMYFSGYIAL